jgi:hypothetical protein
VTPRERFRVTQAQREAIAKRFARGMGRRRIAVAERLPERAVREALQSLGLRRHPQRPWSTVCHPDLWPDAYRPELEGPYTHEAHLKHTAGERSVRRLARELGRTTGSVRRQLSVLAMSMPDLRTELTVRQVADIVGRPESYVMAAIRRGELGARKLDNAWRIWPSEVRDWLDTDPERVLPACVGLATDEATGEPITGGWVTLWALARAQL